LLCSAGSCFHAMFSTAGLCPIIPLAPLSSTLVCNYPV
jgi:hypothetical protein